LRLYENLGYLVGDADFPAVGGFAYLPGPGDSAYAMLALSIPNNALRFRPATPGFLARYRVTAVVGDTLAAIARLDETEEVRVRSFRETSRRDESIVFQAMMKLPPGAYPAQMEVRDLNSLNGFTAALDLRVPRFDPPFVTPPIAVYQAEPRADRDSLPALILNPRATVELGGRALLYVEGQPAAPVILEVYEADHPVLSDTIPGPAAGQESLRASVLPLEASSLAPGVLTLLTHLPGRAASDSVSLAVALISGWVVADFREAVNYLRYAGTPSELDVLRTAPPGERAQVLHSLWERRDSDPETAEHEFFLRYFDRIREANNRFGDTETPGWLTDRGAAYVTFGPPDEVLRYLDAQAGPDNSQAWLYDESLGFELRLVFADVTGSGAYGLTVESRRAFLEAVENLYTGTVRR
jgi:GWxTD domain-containing protein